MGGWCTFLFQLPELRNGVKIASWWPCATSPPFPFLLEPWLVCSAALFFSFGTSVHWRRALLSLFLGTLACFKLDHFSSLLEFWFVYVTYVPFFCCCRNFDSFELLIPFSFSSGTVVSFRGAPFPLFPRGKIDLSRSCPFPFLLKWFVCAVHLTFFQRILTDSPESRSFPFPLWDLDWFARRTFLFFPLWNLGSFVSQYLDHQDNIAVVSWSLDKFASLHLHTFLLGETILGHCCFGLSWCYRHDTIVAIL